jgi:hypothetical protein
LTRQGFPFALALLAGALLCYTPARGVTLGNVASQSGLGQPLRVVIPIMLASGETLNAACLKLVADNTSGAPEIVTARVNLEQASTTPRLVITTANTVNEPAIRLAVQAGCASTSRRDYVLLLDPPALESPTMVASADAEDPPWIVAARERAMAERASPRPRVHPIAAINLDPASAPRLSTWGTPVATGPVTPTHSTLPAPPQNRSVATPPPVVASAPPAPVITRPFVNMVGGSSAFIPEAAAAPLPPRPATTTPLRQTTPQSIPLIPRAQPQAPSLPTMWQNWPYVAAVVGMLLLGFGAFALRRRLALAFSRADGVPLKGETQAATFAHFEAMTEPVSIKPRSTTHPEVNVDQTVAVAEIDTLLADIRSDMIDEKAVKDAWKEAATDPATDIGTDSILKAIAAAERALEIGAPPEPPHTTMDATLENDLLTVPNTPAKHR